VKPNTTLNDKDKEVNGDFQSLTSSPVHSLYFILPALSIGTLTALPASRSMPSY